MVEDGLHEKQGGMFVSRYEVSRAAQCSSNQQQMPELSASSCRWPSQSQSHRVPYLALPCVGGEGKGRARHDRHGMAGEADSAAQMAWC